MPTNPFSQDDNRRGEIAIPLRGLSLVLRLPRAYALG